MVESLIEPGVSFYYPVLLVSLTTKSQFQIKSKLSYYYMQLETLPNFLEQLQVIGYSEEV